jgi:hypothetical protein
MRMRIQWTYALTMLFVDDLKLAHIVALDPTLELCKPGVQLFDEGLGLCPDQHDHDSGMGKSGLCTQAFGTHAPSERA